MDRLDQHNELFSLERQGPDWVSMARNAELDFTYERTELLGRLVAQLGNGSVLVVGPEGVGKRSLVRALAYRIHRMERDNPEREEQTRSLFPYRHIRVTDPFALTLDAHYASELGDKLAMLARKAFETRTILFVHDIGTAVGTGSYSSAPQYSVANLLASCLERHPIRVIGSTTAAGHQLLSKKAPMLLRHLSVVEVGPVSEDDLGPWFQRFEDHLRTRMPVRFEHGFVDEVLSSCSRYFSTLPYPGKAIEMIRSVLENKRTDIVNEYGVERAETITSVLEPGDVQEHVALLSGLPKDLISNDPMPGSMQRGLRTFFESRVIGQPEAIESAISLVLKFRSRLTDPGKPITVCWLSGTTGVGKTEFAKAVAEFFFGTPDRMIRLDMSEFQTAENLERLIGVSENRERMSATTPCLVEQIRSEPFSVILLDEVEKASPFVLDLFLQVFEDARLTGANGRIAHFTNTVILLTSNLGAELYEPPAGFTKGEPKSPVADEVRKVLDNNFRPEFVNRIEQVIPFRRLTREDVAEILRKELQSLARLPGLKDTVETIYLSPEVLELVLDHGYVPQYGARPLRRAISDYLIAPLSLLLSAESITKRSSVVVEGDRPEARVITPKSVSSDWLSYTLWKRNG